MDNSESKESLELGKWQINSETKPTKYGRYLVYRARCNKMHFEVWNTTGWAYNNHDISHWCDVKIPTLNDN